MIIKAHLDVSTYRAIKQNVNVPKIVNDTQTVHNFAIIFFMNYSPN